MTFDFDFQIALASPDDPSLEGFVEVWPAGHGEPALPCWADLEQTSEGMETYTRQHRDSLVALFTHARAQEREGLQLRCVCDSAEHCTCPAWAAAVAMALGDWAAAQEPGTLTLCFHSWREAGHFGPNGAQLDRDGRLFAELLEVARRVRRRVSGSASSLVQVGLHKAIERGREAPPLRSARGFVIAWIRFEALTRDRRAARRGGELRSDLIPPRSEDVPARLALQRESLDQLPAAYEEFARRVRKAQPGRGAALLAAVARRAQGDSLALVVQGMTGVNSPQHLSKLLLEVVRPIGREVFGPLLADSERSLAREDALLDLLGLGLSD